MGYYNYENRFFKLFSRIILSDGILKSNPSAVEFAISKKSSWIIQIHGQKCRVSGPSFIGDGGKQSRVQRRA